jgi:hypothetical protein
MKDAVVLIIRHADDAASGPGLSPQGQARAQAYVPYFQNYFLDGQQVRLDYLMAAADSDKSHRPTLTLEPLSQALNLKVHADISNKEYVKAAKDLQSKKHHKAFLVCWHHGDIPDLLRALGAEPSSLLGGKKWPDDEYGWVLQLPYDSNGRLISDEVRRLETNPNETLSVPTRTV